MTIKEIAYKRFQLFWLQDHGYGMEDLFRAISNCAMQQVEEGESLEAYYLQDAFEESGLDGSIYPCFEEFLTSEYTIIPLMHQLLSEDEFREYVKDRGLDSCSLLGVSDSISVNTPHGTIHAYNDGGLEYPGIGLFFIPKGKDFDASCPGVVMEYNPTYRGFGQDTTEHCRKKVVLWVYSKDNPDDEPQACFEME